MHDLPRPLRRLSLTLALALPVVLAAITPGATLAAGAPEQFGPFEDSYDFIGMSCDGFDIRIQGAGTTAFTVWFDANGDPDRYLQRSRAPYDTLTNTVTGKSIIVRGEFNEHATYDAAAGDWRVMITGFRYVVNVPGAGITIRDVGRIIYGDADQTMVLTESGVHELAYDAQFLPVFCGALD